MSLDLLCFAWSLVRRQRFRKQITITEKVEREGGRERETCSKDHTTWDVCACVLSL